MLKQRIITAVLLAPILLTIVIYGNPYWFAFLVFVLQSAATYEWLKINKLSITLAILNGVVIGIFTYFITYRYHLSLQSWIILYGFIWLLALLWLKNHRWGYDNSSQQLLTKGILGVLAIALFAVALIHLYAIEDGKWWTLALFFLIWVADIGAYASGKLMGQHKLAINISPGKTWEGVVGAQLLVAVYAIVISIYLDLTWQKALLIMIPVALFSVVGDLSASLGKRQAQVKDSSNLLPGHGGFIDRFDSLIAAAPLYFFLLQTT